MHIEELFERLQAVIYMLSIYAIWKWCNVQTWLLYYHGAL